MRWAVLLVPLFLVPAQADEDWRQNGNSKAAVEGGQCVRPTPWMRRNHMALIKHDREITVHQGVRTIDGSLAQCVACHVNRAEDGHYLPVNDAQQFCAGCHEFTGTTLDCFSCHATVPVELAGDRQQ
jgi:predicted CXXCH cytochrome family protein